MTDYFHMQDPFGQGYTLPRVVLQDANHQVWINPLTDGTAKIYPVGALRPNGSFDDTFSAPVQGSFSLAEALGPDEARRVENYAHKIFHAGKVLSWAEVDHATTNFVHYLNHHRTNNGLSDSQAILNYHRAR